MGKMSNGQDWPTREEWAKGRRMYYSGRRELAVPDEANNYCTPAEIAAILARLKQTWRAWGRELQALKELVRPLTQQPGETKTAYLKRYLAMSEVDKERIVPYSLLQERRQRLNRAIKSLEDGPISSEFGQSYLVEYRHLAQPLLDRYDKALKDAYEEGARQVALTPIDDAAWEEELEHRRRCETDGFIQVCHHYH